MYINVYVNLRKYVCTCVMVWRMSKDNDYVSKGLEPSNVPKERGLSAQENGSGTVAARSLL